MSSIPSTILQPLFYAEVDSSRAGSGSAARASLLIGQKLTAGTATANVPVRVTSAAQARTLFGVGSHLARMVAYYRKNDAVGELWALPVAAPSTAATGTLELTGPATANGTLSLYIGGQLLSVPVVSTDTADAIGVKIQALLGADETAALALNSEFPVTASNSSGTVTLTARNAGPGGNKIDVRVNYLGSPQQDLPAGVGVSITPMASGGAADAVLTTAITNIETRRYHMVAVDSLTATELDRITSEFADSTAGRWGAIRRQYGHVIMADRGTYTVLSTTGLAAAINNDPHMSAIAGDLGPCPPWEVAAAFAGAAAQSTRNDPAKPLNGIVLDGILAPAEADDFSWSEREVLLGLGITTLIATRDRRMAIQRWITTYTADASGVPNDAYLDGPTLTNLDYQLTELENLLSSKYAGHKLVNDSAILDAGQAVVTPSMVWADIVAQYRAWERAGLVEDVDTFASLLTVERDGTDPNRLNILYPPDLANGLHVLALSAQFRLQYTEADRA